MKVKDVKKVEDVKKVKVKDVKVCSTFKVTISTVGKAALIERLVTYSEWACWSQVNTALRWLSKPCCMSRRRCKKN